MSIIADRHRLGTSRFQPRESLRELLNRLSTDVGVLPRSEEDIGLLLICLLRYPNLFEQAAAEHDFLPFDT